MSQPDKKLDKFTSAVLSDAQARRAKILAEIEDYRKAEMEKAEEDILHEAYIMIQNEISAIKNRQSKTVSLAELEGRRKFLRQREDIMGKVFSRSFGAIRYSPIRRNAGIYADKLCGDVGAKLRRNMPEGALVIQPEARTIWLMRTGSPRQAAAEPASKRTPPSRSAVLFS
jgi:V/A-type H+-transporting ATPase subunit E